MKTIMFIYKYLFYRIYKTIKGINSKYNSTIIAHNSILFISFLLTVDLDFTLRLVANRTEWEYKKLHFFLIFGIIYITNLLLFYRVYNYKKIEEEFFKESKKAYTVSLISTILFIGVSLLPIVRLFFLQAHNMTQA